MQGPFFMDFLLISADVVPLLCPLAICSGQCSAAECTRDSHSEDTGIDCLTCPPSDDARYLGERIRQGRKGLEKVTNVCVRMTRNAVVV